MFLWHPLCPCPYHISSSKIHYNYFTIARCHMQTIHLLRLNVMCGGKKNNHPPIYCTNRPAVIITIVIILHSPFRLYARYLPYASCIFRCICELAPFGISIQLLFVSFLSNIVDNCFYYLCSKCDDIVNKLLKYEK